MYTIEHIEHNYYTASLPRSVARASFPGLGVFGAQLVLCRGLRRLGLRAVVFQAEISDGFVVFHIIFQ